jgi:hypothetical protein
MKFRSIVQIIALLGLPALLVVPPNFLHEPLHLGRAVVELALPATNVSVQVYFRGAQWRADLMTLRCAADYLLRADSNGALAPAMAPAVPKPICASKELPLIESSRGATN